MIIGITGSIGAGKGVVTDFLKEKGLNHYSVRDFLVEEIKKWGMPVNRDSMVTIANELRKNNSPSYIVEQLYEKAKKENKDCVIESIRTLGEIEALRKKEAFFLISIDADPEIRYKRTIKRGGEKDSISFEKFIQDEKRELSSNDPNKQNLSACITASDFKLTNNEN